MNAPMHKPRGGLAVMAERRSPQSSLDAFWTPPWGTRSLCEAIGLRPGDARQASMTAWDPAAGMHLMSDVLGEYFLGGVQASDVFDYRMAARVGSFVGQGADVIAPPADGVDWIITNPPFKLAEQFAARALEVARFGVALLCRTVFIESAERYALFQRHPLSVFAPFAGRLPMVQGRWDPKASSATSYAWFVFMRGQPSWQTRLIPPDAKTRLTRPDDVARFAPWALVDDDYAAIDAMAHLLCERDGVDPDAKTSCALRDTLTYRESRDKRNKDKLSADWRAANWVARRREADDVLADDLIRKQRWGSTQGGVQ